MDEKSNEAQSNETTPPLPPPISRRDFLAGAAACAVISPTLLRAAGHPPDPPTVLHVASHIGYIHTYGLTSDDCKLLGATAVDSCAALASHPLLPVLYIARDCQQWEALPRGVIETYAVKHDMHPLRLLAQTPMALSATGPRSLAVSSCGQHLLVAASTGGAWNAFALDRGGVPAGVAIARKETGAMQHSHTVALPTPRGLVFSRHATSAIGTDPGSGRMTLLQPSSEQLVALARYQTPYGLTSASPVWTSDGRYIIAADGHKASLSVYEIELVSGDGGNAKIRPLGTTSTATPVTTLVAHPAQPAVFTSRRQGSGSRLELWKIRGSDLRLAGNTWVSGHVVALAEHAGDLWVASHDRLIRLSVEDLGSPHAFELPLPMRGTQAIAAQNLIAL
jgi:6-phosphogluconolactonase (cycloisomerase 2 family)